MKSFLIVMILSFFTHNHLTVGELYGGNACGKDAWGKVPSTLVPCSRSPTPWSLVLPSSLEGGTCKGTYLVSMSLPSQMAPLTPCRTLAISALMGVTPTRPAGLARGHSSPASAPSASEEMGAPAMVQPSVLSGRWHGRQAGRRCPDPVPDGGCGWGRKRLAGVWRHVMLHTRCPLSNVRGTAPFFPPIECTESKQRSRICKAIHHCKNTGVKGRSSQRCL